MNVCSTKELRAKIASEDYGAELCLQHAMANIDALEMQIEMLRKSAAAVAGPALSEGLGAGAQASDDWMTTLWLGATRYYLGRMTYAVSDFRQGLCLAWEHLPQSTRKLIARDVEGMFDLDDQARRERENGFPLGHDIDRKQWELVRELWADSAPSEQLT